MCKLRVHPDVDYNNLMIYGMSPKHISVILSQQKPSSDELAALVSREYKEEQFDRCLSEERLNREFASTCLDVDKAWAKLHKLSTRFGSEDFYNDEDMEYDDDEDSDKIEDNACNVH